MRGSWTPNRTAKYWPPLLWPSAFLSLSPRLVNLGPGGPASLGTGFLYRILSTTRLIPKNSIGGPESPFCWVLFFSTASFLQISDLQTNWLPVFTKLYNSSTPTQSLPITGHRNIHFRRLWNGMFDRHRAEITVMQFTGRSLPVHQFVTSRGILTLSHVVSQAHPCQQNMHFCRLWNGMFGRVGGQYTTGWLEWFLKTGYAAVS